MKFLKTHHKILLIMIGAGFLLGAPVLFFSRNQKSAPLVSQSIEKEDMTPDVGVADIVINDEGFAPQTVTVQVGSQVVWTNKGVREHAITTDVSGPSGSSLAGPPNDELAPGDSLTFITSRPGIIHYHDEMNPLKPTGTIVVK